MNFQINGRARNSLVILLLLGLSIDHPVPQFLHLKDYFFLKKELSFSFSLQVVNKDSSPLFSYIFGPGPGKGGDS